MFLVDLLYILVCKVYGAEVSALVLVLVMLLLYRTNVQYLLDSIMVLTVCVVCITLVTCLVDSILLAGPYGEPI